MDMAEQWRSTAVASRWPIDTLRRVVPAQAGTQAGLHGVPTGRLAFAGVC